MNVGLPYIPYTNYDQYLKAALQQHRDFLKQKGITVVALDLGRNGSKPFNGEKYFHFPSKISNWKKRNNPVYLKGDLELKYDNDMVFIGTLAERESTVFRELFTETKANPDLKYLAMAAFYFLGVEGDVHVVTGLPLSNFTPEERKGIRNILKGPFQYEVREDGDWQPRAVNVTKVAFGLECGVAFNSHPKYANEDFLVFVDVGGKTVLITVYKRVTDAEGNEHMVFIENLSRTFTWGWDTEKPSENKEKEFAGKIIGELGRLGLPEDAKIVTIGGVAKDLAPLIAEKFPNTEPHPKPLFATAVGLWVDYVSNLMKKDQEEKQKLKQQIDAKLGVIRDPKADPNWRY